MAYLDQGAKNAGLYEDLEFIKKTLRYPLRRALLLPLLAWSLIIAALFFFTVFRLLADTHLSVGKHWFAGLIPLVFAVPVIAGLLRYLRSLKFAVLPTGRRLAENRILLEHFLTAQQLQVVNHPMSNDIFQIVSTPVSAKTRDMRQVMVFIADEGRILLNSHFTSNGLMVAPASRLHSVMKAQLEAWISTAGKQTGGSALQY